MSALLSFVGGLAQGATAGIIRKEDRKQKLEDQDTELDNQIKLMKERAKEEERLFEAKRKMQRADAEAENVALYQSLNIPQEASLALAKAGDKLQPYIIDYAKNNPDTDWNTVLKITELTRDPITNTMKPTYAIDTMAIFKPQPKTFSDLETRLGATTDALVAAQIALQEGTGSAEEVTKYEEQMKIIKAQMLPPEKEYDLLDGSRVTTIRKAELYLNMGEYAKDMGDEGLSLQDITQGKTFDFAEKYSGFMESFDETMKPYLKSEKTKAVVQAQIDSNRKILQNKLNSSIAEIERIYNSETPTGQTNKIISQVDGKNLIFEQGNKSNEDFTAEIEAQLKKIQGNVNDLIKIRIINSEGNAQSVTALWGGTLENSMNNNGRFKYKAESFGSTPTNWQ